MRRTVRRFRALGLALTAWGGPLARRRDLPALVAAGAAERGRPILVRVDFAPAVVLGAVPILALVVRAQGPVRGGFLGSPASIPSPRDCRDRNGSNGSRAISSRAARADGTCPTPWGYPGNFFSWQSR